MWIRVLLGILGVVIGTFGSTTDKNGTTSEIFNATKTVPTTKFPDIGNDKTKNEIKNNSEEISDHSSSPISLLNNEMNSTIISIINNEIKNEIKNNSEEISDHSSSPISLLNNEMNSTMISIINQSVPRLEIEPKNVILVMIEGKDYEGSWAELKRENSFEVDGFYESCPINKEFNDTNVTTMNNNKNCECSQMLKSNVSILITYARLFKGMNTATVSEGNITQQKVSPPYYFHHHQHHRHLRLADKSHSLNINEQSPSSIQLTASKTLKPSKSHSSIEYNNNFDNDKIKNFFNILIQFRSMIFKNLFDFLNENTSPHHNGLMKSQKPSLFFPNEKPSRLSQFIADTLEELESISHDKRFFMNIIAPHNELAKIHEVIQRQPLAKDNLIIITSLDPSDDESQIPYVANGPGSNYFNNLRNIQELPLKIKLTLDRCHEICKNNESTFSTILPMESLVPKKRVARADEEEEEETAKNPDVEVNEEEDDRQRSSGFSFHLKKDFIFIIFSFVSSIMGSYILHT